MAKSARISDISLRYMAAMYSPRDCMEPPNVPKDTSLSQKVRTFARGSLATGTTGYGAIVVRAPDMLTSDGTIVTASTATTVATSATVVTAMTNVDQTPRSNSPFTGAQFGATSLLLSWKIVGCALYVKYAGTQNNKGGDMILLEHPSHATVNATSYNTALAYDGAKRVDVSDAWQHVCWTPASEADTQYNPANPSGLAVYPLGIFINSAGATQPFDYEIYCWWECVGQLARGATISFDDPIGFAAVSGAVNAFSQLDSVLGSHGLVTAVETQLQNMSGIGLTSSHPQNWAGLASFLPAIAKLAPTVLRGLGGAASGILQEYGYSKAPAVRKERVAPLVRVATHPPIPPRVPKPPPRKESLPRKK